jgi:nucleotide-binding universal stress UspA family protein
MLCPPYQESEGLVRIAMKLCTSLKGKITALCVRSDITQKYYSPFSIQLGKIPEEEKKALKKIIKCLGEEVVMLKRGGAVASQVLDEAEKHYDLLLMKDTDKKLTKKIAEYSHIPTLIYRKGDKLEKILVCTDGSKHSSRAVKFAGMFAKGLEGEITVLSVARENKEQKKREEAVNKAAEMLNQLSIKNVKKLIEGGQVRDVILQNANHYDLVALAPRGLGKLERALLGHVSLYVLENAKTNVLLIR